jgi:hypothetical protein
MPIHNSGITGQEQSEYNVFNFERYKWGGVRHTSPEYALFDLEQFLQLPKVTPTEEDWSIMRGGSSCSKRTRAKPKGRGPSSADYKEEASEIQQGRSRSDSGYPGHLRDSVQP